MLGPTLRSCTLKNRDPPNAVQQLGGGAREGTPTGALAKSSMPLGQELTILNRLPLW